MKTKLIIISLAVLAAFIGCKNLSVPTEVTQPADTQILIDSEALVSVPGGTYTQDYGYYSFQHTISAFKMGKYEVTYELWYKVFQWAIINGYAFKHPGCEGSEGTDGMAPTVFKYQPVTMIDWRDAIVWCNAYSQMEGLDPVYYSDELLTTPLKDSTNDELILDTTPGSYDNPYVNWDANGYRLPTASEWQYAASYIDGIKWTPYNYASGATASYDNLIPTGLVAWYAYNSWETSAYYVGYTTHSVGGKKANALGIYDMSGNVYEWCWDWGGSIPSYPGTSTNYRGAINGEYRAMRGGFYRDNSVFLQVGYCKFESPYYRSFMYGLRLVKS